MPNERFETTCRYYDPENGWCRLKSSWKDSMPEIVECEAVGCAEFEEESGCEYCPMCGRKMEG